IITRMPALSATSAANSGSRPSSIGQGSTNDDTPSDLISFNFSTAFATSCLRLKPVLSSSQPGNPAVRCSWISVKPNSLGSQVPATVLMVAIDLLVPPFAMVALLSIAGIVRSTEFLVNHLPPGSLHDPHCLADVSLRETVMRDRAEAATANVADLDPCVSQQASERGIFRLTLLWSEDHEVSLHRVEIELHLR